MTEITYKISIGENGQLVDRKEVTGFLAFELYGYQWAVHQEVDDDHYEWVVSEVSSGFGLLNLDDMFTKRGGGRSRQSISNTQRRDHGKTSC